MERNMKAMIVYLIKDLEPAKTVSTTSFKSLMNGLSPTFKLPDIETVNKCIDKMYEQAELSLRSMLEQIKFCAITCDTWTNSTNTRTYLEISVHFIKEFKHKSYVLGLIYLEKSFTPKILRDKLKSLIFSWGFHGEEIIAWVTDNNPIVVQSIELLVESKRRLIPCFANSLNVLFKQAIFEVSEFNAVVEKMQNIAEFLRNENAAREFEKEAGRKGLTRKRLKLIEEEDKGWNSYFIMIERFLLLKDCVHFVLSELKSAPEMITKNELETLEDGLKILKPFHLITVEMASENPTPISKIIPILGLISNALTEVVPATEIGKKLLDCVLKNFRKEFQNIESNFYHIAATLLDLRFKMVDFKFSPLCKFFSVLYLKSELATFPEYGLTNFDSDDLWADRQAGILGVKKTPAWSLETFLDAAVLSHESDPLEAWKVMEMFNVNLCSLALKYLCIPATCVPAERLFTKMGNIQYDRRVYFEPKERLEKMLILNSMPSSELDAFTIE